MDLLLRKAERDDPLRYLINWCRVTGATFAGNIKAKTEQLWLLRSYNNLRDTFAIAQREARIQRRIKLRMEARRIWFGKQIRNRPHNITVYRDWETKHFRYDERAGGHIEIDTREYWNSCKAGETWFSMQVARNE